LANPSRHGEWVAAVGARLAQTRKALDPPMTQADLASFLNVSQGAVGNWESGRSLADIGAMTRFCDRFGVPLDWIYRGDHSNLPLRLATPLLGRTSTPSGDSPRTFAIS
jgi:transcriptional regulator with XRE-family HTH domain